MLPNPSFCSPPASLSAFLCFPLLFCFSFARAARHAARPHHHHATTNITPACLFVWCSDLHVFSLCSALLALVTHHHPLAFSNAVGVLAKIIWAMLSLCLLIMMTLPGR
jgi:hypothetical protein